MPRVPASRVNRRAVLALGIVATFIGSAALAAPPINTIKPGLFGGRGDTAILGYDPVAYFTQGRPVKGQDALVHEWQGAKWKFASQSHLALFKASPEKFAPQYGGYCAYGVSQGYLVKVDPEAWSVIDGKLYLNYDAKVQAAWTKDAARYIKLADGKFPALLSQ